MYGSVDLGGEGAYGQRWHQLLVGKVAELLAQSIVVRSVGLLASKRIRVNFYPPFADVDGVDFIVRLQHQRKTVFCEISVRSGKPEKLRLRCKGKRSIESFLQRAQAGGHRAGVFYLDRTRNLLFFVCDYEIHMCSDNLTQNTISFSTSQSPHEQFSSFVMDVLGVS